MLINRTKLIPFNLINDFKKILNNVHSRSSNSNILRSSQHSSVNVDEWHEVPANDSHDESTHQSNRHHHQNYKSVQASKKHTRPFNSMYPWNTLDEFVDHLERRIVYRDQNLIAIDKPWGIAYHKTYKTLYKPYSFETLSMIPGDPKFCMNDALSILSERLDVEKLEYVKTIDRYSSGIVLLSTGEDAKPIIRKSLNTNRSEGLMCYNFLCIAQGFPAIDGDELSEKVRIKLRDVDELADYREPIIIDPVYRKQDQDPGYLVRVRIKNYSVNKANSSSFIQVSTNKLKWNFVRCYVAHKAAFVIGDLRFSANIKRVLGEQVLETTNSFYKNNQIEPLNREIRSALGVKSNKQVPVMLHLDSMTLRKYNGPELLIACKQLPAHFDYALERLKLIDTFKGLPNQNSHPKDSPV